MASPVICIRDASIKNSQLLVKDMWPNRSQANPVVDPTPQGPRYLRVVETPTLPVLNGTVVSRTVSGLASYLLVTLDLQAGDDHISPAQAVEVSLDLITEMRAGNDLTQALINGVIQAADNPNLNATGIGLGNSSTTVNNILQILSGATFTVEAGYDLEDENGNKVFLDEAGQLAKLGSFFNPIVEEDSSFWISLAQGDLSGMKSADFVVVYDGAGTAQ
jgi:hypothetical protein